MRQSEAALNKTGGGNIVDYKSNLCSVCGLIYNQE